MNRKELIQWIRKNDEIYSEIRLSVFNDKELFYIIRKIKHWNNSNIRMGNSITKWENLTSDIFPYYYYTCGSLHL